MSRSGTELFPRVDAKQFQIYVRLPSGTRIEETERQLARLEAALIRELGEPDPEYPQLEKHKSSYLRMLITNIGVLNDWPAAYTPNSGPGDAFVLVQLKDSAPDVFGLVERLRTTLGDEFPRAELSFDTGGMLTAALNNGEPAPIHYQVRGSDLRTLGDIAAQVVRVIKTVPGARDVRLMQKYDQPTINIDIDRVRAAVVGVTVKDIMHNLITATNSSINFRPAFWIDQRNGNHYFIGAQYPETDMVSLDSLRDIPIAPAGGGKPVPLRSVATVKRGVGPSYVSHRNITRVVDIYADAAPGTTVGEVVADIERGLRRDQALALVAKKNRRGEDTYLVGGQWKGRGYVIGASGEVVAMHSAFKQFSAGLAIAVVLIYLLLIAKFRSFIDSLMILFTVVFGFIGVAIALGVSSTSINVQSFMGTLMMVGIVIEHGVILVDFANHGVANGMTVRQAAVDAARIRLRPIVMTTLVAALAVLPMAVGFGGAEADMPLARAMVGGVLGAGVLTLFVLPALYTMMNRPPNPPEQAPGAVDDGGSNHQTPASAGEPHGEPQHA